MIKKLITFKKNGWLKNYRFMILSSWDVDKNQSMHFDIRFLIFEKISHYFIKIAYKLAFQDLWN